MRDEQMPDHRLKGFRVRRYSVGIDRWHDRDGVADFCRVTPIAADDTEYLCPDLLGILQRTNQIGTDILFEVAATDGKYEDRVGRLEPACL